MARAASDDLYNYVTSLLYTDDVDVAVSELRAHLSRWLERVRNGDEVVITERGVPVARILGVNAATTLERLTEQGVIARPALRSRPVAAGRDRPRPRRPLADRVSEQRG